MRSTISPDCATARRSRHDLFPSDGCAKRTAAQGCPQGSPMPQVPRHVPQRVGRRADLFSLQEHGCVADGRAPADPSRQQAPIVARPGVSVQLAEDNAKGEVCRTAVHRNWGWLRPSRAHLAGGGTGRCRGRSEIRCATAGTPSVCHFARLSRHVTPEGCGRRG